MADDRTIKIKLSTYGDEAAVAPSLLGDDRILVGFFAANGMPEHPQVFTPTEWDAFVAAGNAALGRAAPASPPLADVFDALATEREAEAKACWSTDGDSYRGEAEAYRKAARMVREQGATPLADRIETEQAPPIDLSGICSEGREEEVYGKGYQQGRIDAARMVRDAGPTVPRADVEALRAALTEALDGWEYCTQYKLDYLVEKHGDKEDIAKLRALRAPKEPSHADD